jgi:hypothetical protein
VRPFPLEPQYWALQPLVDAGLDAEQINDLLVRLCFDVVVRGEEGTPADAMTPVQDRSAEVRAAWAETIDRMARLGPDEGLPAVTGSASPRFRRTRRPRSGRPGPGG